jgi:hypothetical protein
VRHEHRRLQGVLIAGGDAGDNEVVDFFFAADERADDQAVARFEAGADGGAAVDDRLHRAFERDLLPIDDARFAGLAGEDATESDLDWVAAVGEEDGDIGPGDGADGLNAVDLSQVAHARLGDAASGDQELGFVGIDDQIGVQVGDELTIAEPKAFGEPGGKEDEQRDEGDDDGDEEEAGLVAPDFLQSQVQGQRQIDDESFVAGGAAKDA